MRLFPGLTIFRYLWGPLGRKMCFLQVTFMNTIKWQSLLLFNAILLSRYAMVIWLKNPAAMKDDFWSVFINQWTFCISILVNFVIFFFPKRLPLIYYKTIKSRILRVTLKYLVSLSTSSPKQDSVSTLIVNIQPHNL